MDRLYWFILSDDEYEREREFVYIVKRGDMDFVFKTQELAYKCADKLSDMYPEELIRIEKKVVRTDYR